jgi:hypothetical protein
MRLAAVVVLAACGGDHAAAKHDASAVDSAGDGPPITPPSTCTVPPEGMLVDVSASSNVVGDGTPASCTAAALQTAVTAAGSIRFNCGSAPITITLTQALKINNQGGASAVGDTVIDGGGLVTLDGAGAYRIIDLDACSPPYNSPNCDSFPHPHLTVERLTFTGAADASTDGGGAIYRKGGALTVIDSVFENNHCAVTGQDTAGGALRLIYPTPTIVVGSTFHNNQCSDGGAIGGLNATPVTIINSTVDGNTATGVGGNPGNGGNAGGLYFDGTMLQLTMCGVQVTNNHGHAYGGGIFYVDDAGQGTVSITNTVIQRNDIPMTSGQPSHGGGGYIQGADITAANVAIDSNSAGFAAGLYVNSMNGRGSLNATNMTVSNQAGDGLNLQGGTNGTLLNCTIANNTRNGIAGAAPMTLANTVLAGNMTNCDAMPTAMPGNVEAGTVTCGGTAGDAQLGALMANGGTTGVPTMAPAAGGAAAGAGAATCPATDARGMARPSTGCTSGAHQL